MKTKEADALHYSTLRHFGSFRYKKRAHNTMD